MIAGARVLLATTLVPDDRKTLASARALSRAGAWVAVASNRLQGEACYSRYVRRRLQYSHPGHDIDRFHQDLNRIIGEHSIDAVLPMNDYTTRTLAQLQDHIPAAVALPSFDTVTRAHSKLRVRELAVQCGLDTPQTWLATSLDELRGIAAQAPYPCVSKPLRGSGGIGVNIHSTPESLLAAWGVAPRPSDLGFDFDRILVQEFIPGETRDACVVCRHGELRAAYTARRRWMHPASGGVGASVETTYEPLLIDHAGRILKALNWHGPADVEFRADPASGRTCLIEINGRLWGGLALAISAGVNIPLLTVQLALNGDCDPVLDYDHHTRFRWPLPFALFALASNRPLQAFREFFLPARNTHSDLEWTDPAPHLAEIAYAVRRLVFRSA